MDPDEALSWMRLAASHGSKEAQEKLDGFNLFLDQIPDAQLRRKGSIA
jgi:hypothetical protein